MLPSFLINNCKEREDGKQDKKDTYRRTDKQTYVQTDRQRIYILWIVNVVLSTSTDFKTRTQKASDNYLWMNQRESVTKERRHQTASDGHIGGKMYLTPTRCYMGTTESRRSGHCSSRSIKYSLVSSYNGDPNRSFSWSDVLSCHFHYVCRHVWFLKLKFIHFTRYNVVK